VTASAGHLRRPLTRALPGERLWFWLIGPDTIAAPALILQPIAADPARDCTNRLIRDAAGGGGLGRDAEQCVIGTMHGNNKVPVRTFSPVFMTIIVCFQKYDSFWFRCGSYI
jgi:hypothetical protein